MIPHRPESFVVFLLVDGEENLARFDGIARILGQEVSFEQGKKLAADFGVTFLEASARANINITEAFEGLGIEVIRRCERPFSEYCGWVLRCRWPTRDSFLLRCLFVVKTLHEWVSGGDRMLACGHLLLERTLGFLIIACLLVRAFLLHAVVCSSLCIVQEPL